MVEGIENYRDLIRCMFPVRSYQNYLSRYKLRKQTILVCQKNMY